MRGGGWRRGGRLGCLRRAAAEALSLLPWLDPRRVERVYYPLPPGDAEPVVLYRDEATAFTLVYLEGLSQEEAAERMGVSRAKLWRLLDSARRKLAEALRDARPIVVAEA